MIVEEKDLVIGTRIRLGDEYCKQHGTPEDSGKVITLVEGSFDSENGLYTETVNAPSVWDEVAGDWDSIFHLFENDLSGFSDCSIL